MKKLILIVAVLVYLAFGHIVTAATDSQGSGTASEKKMTSAPDGTKKQKADDRRQAGESSKKKNKIVIPGKDLS